MRESYIEGCILCVSSILFPPHAGAQVEHPPAKNLRISREVLRHRGLLLARFTNRDVIEDLSVG